MSDHGGSVRLRTAPPYLLRDRDQIYGKQFRPRVKSMGIHEVLTAPHSHYHHSRTHLALDKDAPDVRSVEPFEAARMVEIPEVGGLL